MEDGVGLGVGLVVGVGEGSPVSSLSWSELQPGSSGWSGLPSPSLSAPSLHAGGGGGGGGGATGGAGAGAGAGGAGGRGAGDAAGSGDSLRSLRELQPGSAGKSLRPSRSSSLPLEHCGALGDGLGEGDGVGSGEGSGDGSGEGAGVATGKASGGCGGTFRLIVLVESATAVGAAGWKRKNRTNGAAPSNRSIATLRNPVAPALSRRYRIRAAHSARSLRNS